MNKTAYLIAQHSNYSGEVSLYVASTTGGESRALNLFRQARGYALFPKVIATRPDSEAQRMINTVNAFSDDNTVVNLRKNKISYDDAKETKLTCGLVAQKIRDFLTEHANLHVKNASEEKLKAERLRKIAMKRL